MSMLPRRSLAVAAALLPLVSLAQDIREAIDGDDECVVTSEGVERCGMSALQVRAATAESDAVAAADGAEAGSGGWSCSYFTCHANYRPWQPCQCNTKCGNFGNCCYDYAPVCLAPPPTPAPAPVTTQWIPPSTTPPPPPVTTSPPLTGVHAEVMTLYHQTSPEICDLIMEGGFKLGHEGWCGGAIYFAVSPEATKTKAVGPQSNWGCMLEAQVRVGKVLDFPCCQYCGGGQGEHVFWTAHSLLARSYDSIKIDPGDGAEHVVYDKSQVLSTRIIPFDPEWMPTARYR